MSYEKNYLSCSYISNMRNDKNHGNFIFVRSDSLLKAQNIFSEKLCFLGCMEKCSKFNKEWTEITTQ